MAGEIPMGKETRRSIDAALHEMLWQAG